VTVYNKNLSSQCNLLAQVEQVQDKFNYINKTFKNNTSIVTLHLVFTVSEVI